VVSLTLEITLTDEVPVIAFWNVPAGDELLTPVPRRRKSCRSPLLGCTEFLLGYHQS